jgi:hypothetical protein
MEVNETAVKAFTGEFITSHPTLQTNMFSRDAAPLCHVVQPYDHHSNAMFADFSMTSAHADYHALLDHELDNLFQHPVEYTMGRADLTFENDTTNLQYNPLQILSPESSSSSHAAFEQVDRRDHYDQPTPGQQSSSGSLRRVQNGSQKRARRLKASVTASKPRAPKIKFTAEEDAKLIELKEMHSLTWNQIAEFFPVRTSGTLQVRYCTKLRAKSTPWSDENVSCLDGHFVPKQWSRYG